MSQKIIKKHTGTSVGPFGPRVRKYIDSIETLEKKRPTTVVHIVAPQPFVSPAHPKQQPSKVLHRQVVRHPHKRVEQQIAELPSVEQYYEPVQQPGRLRTALQSCFGLFA